MCNSPKFVDMKALL